MSRTRHRGRWVLLPDGPVPDAVVELEDGVVEGVRPARAGDPPPWEGWVVPGLVNAHTHLELSGRGLVAGGDGFMGWGARLMAEPRVPSPEAEAAAARAMGEAGTAGVFDVTNGGHTGPVLAAAGLRGVAQHELLSWRPGIEERVAAASVPARAGRVAARPGAHAVYSTPPELLQAACAARDGIPSSLHLGEDEAELLLVRDGAGPFRDWLASMGVSDEALGAFGHGEGLLAYLDRLGILGPELILVHGVWLDAEERAALASRGISVCLCPRSNLHITQRLPPADAMVAAGVPLALGTDSLASSPDLDVLGEVALLAEAFPGVDPLRWLVAATAGGARALRRPDLGTFRVGASPGVLGLSFEHPRELARRPPARWLEPPCLP